MDDSVGQDKLYAVLADITSGKVAKVSCNEKMEGSIQHVGVDAEGYPKLRFGGLHLVRCFVVEYKEGSDG